MPSPAETPLLSPASDGTDSDGTGRDGLLIDGDLALYAIASWLGPDRGEPQQVLDIIAGRVRESGDLPPSVALREGLERANRFVFERDAPRAGCSVAALSLQGKQATLAHVGDDSVFRFRDGQIESLTKPHTLLGRYSDAQIRTPTEIGASSHHTVLVRALGMTAGVEVEIQTLNRTAPELWLLASGAIVGTAGPALIRETVARPYENLRECCRAILALSPDRQGTALLVRT